MSFKVIVPSTGHEFHISDNETVLEAALRQGIGLPYGCRNGTCGKCAAELISGTVEYVDDTLHGSAALAHKGGKTILCQARVTSDIKINVREIMSNQDLEIKILPCRVERKELLTHDIMKIELRLPETERLQFLAGQYVEFLLKDGKRRAFSIANPPHNDGIIELHIRHVPDGQFGDYVFEGLKEKTLLRIEGPFGNYFLREDTGRPVIMVGGGTGFAPLKGMLEHAFHVGFNAPIHLFCGVRALRDLYMEDMVQEWVQTHKNLRYTPVLSEPMPGDKWQGMTGFVHEAIVEAYPDLSGHDVYLSGPPPMVKAGMDAFYKHGLPEDQIFSDSFEYSDDALKAMGITKPGS